MNFKISFIIALAALLVTGCSTDEPISPSGEISTETDEQGFLKNVVPAEGRTIDFTFSTNCDWNAVCYDSDFHVDIMPESGKAGENTIVVTLPENTSSEWDRSCDINIISTDGAYLFAVRIMQDKKPCYNFLKRRLILSKKHLCKALKSQLTKSLK